MLDTVRHKNSVYRKYNLLYNNVISTKGNGEVSDYIKPYVVTINFEINRDFYNKFYSVENVTSSSNVGNATSNSNDKKSNIVVHRISAWWTDNEFNESTSISYSNFLSELKGMFDNVTSMFGFKIMFPVMFKKIFDRFDGETFNISATLEFVSETDAYKDVYVPVRLLETAFMPDSSVDFDTIDNIVSKMLDTATSSKGNSFMASVTQYAKNMLKTIGQNMIKQPGYPFIYFSENPLIHRVLIPSIELGEFITFYNIQPKSCDVQWSIKDLEYSDTVNKSIPRRAVVKISFTSGDAFFVQDMVDIKNKFIYRKGKTPSAINLNKLIAKIGEMLTPEG